MERGRRIELLALAWKAKVLPLYEPRIHSCIIAQLLLDVKQPASSLAYPLHNWQRKHLA